MPEVLDNNLCTSHGCKRMQVRVRNLISSQTWKHHVERNINAPLEWVKLCFLRKLRCAPPVLRDGVAHLQASAYGLWCSAFRHDSHFSRFFAMESQTQSSKQAPRKSQSWRVQGNPPTLCQPFASLVPTLCQPFANPLPTLSANPSPSSSFRAPESRA